MNNNTISPDANNLTCITSGCSQTAITEIWIKSEKSKVYRLSLCLKCRQQYFPDYPPQPKGDTEPPIIDDKDIPLHFITKEKCSCNNCPDEASVFLEIVRVPKSGYFCERCSIDLEIHGIAQEVGVQ